MFVVLEAIWDCPEVVYEKIEEEGVGIAGEDCCRILGIAEDISEDCWRMLEIAMEVTAEDCVLLSIWDAL